MPVETKHGHISKRIIKIDKLRRAALEQTEPIRTAPRYQHGRHSALVESRDAAHRGGTGRGVASLSWPGPALILYSHTNKTINLNGNWQFL